MKHIFWIGTLLLIFVSVSAQGQTANPAAPLELKKLDVWAGDWALSGTAKDKPDSPAYKVVWRLHERWILNGYFLQVHQTWKGNDQVLQGLEMLGYDRAKKVYTDYGFGSDGSTWFLTASFHNNTMTESGISKGPNGEPMKCRMTWAFTNRGSALSGTQVCETNGSRWTAVSVRGTKIK
ncbi:MAG: DUF1579 family protein [Gammaproteobacteria bacterium]|nr:DUF1579 family protein [Gammaproteobacteria bacterium]